MYSMFMIFYDEIHDRQDSVCILSAKYMKDIYHFFPQGTMKRDPLRPSSGYIYHIYI